MKSFDSSDTSPTQNMVAIPVFDAVETGVVVAGRRGVVIDGKTIGLVTLPTEETTTGIEFSVIEDGCLKTTTRPTRRIRTAKKISTVFLPRIERLYPNTNIWSFLPTPKPKNMPDLKQFNLTDFGKVGIRVNSQ